jgi:hypothetical protein
MKRGPSFRILLGFKDYAQGTSPQRFLRWQEKKMHHEESIEK